MMSCGGVYFSTDCVCVFVCKENMELWGSKKDDAEPLLRSLVRICCRSLKLPYINKITADKCRL